MEISLARSKDERIFAPLLEKEGTFFTKMGHYKSNSGFNLILKGSMLISVGLNSEQLAFTQICSCSNYRH